MESYAVTSPHGPMMAASWWCQRCQGGTGNQLLDPADPAGPDRLRNEAMRHVSTTGHRVEFRRGTVEDLEPLSTALPAACDPERCRAPFGAHAPTCRLPAAPE